MFNDSLVAHNTQCSSYFYKSCQSKICFHVSQIMKEVLFLRADAFKYSVNYFSVDFISILLHTSVLSFQRHLNTSSIYSSVELGSSGSIHHSTSVSSCGLTEIKRSSNSWSLLTNSQIFIGGDAFQFRKASSGMGSSCIFSCQSLSVV